MGWPDKTKTLGETLRALDKEPGNLGGKDEQSVKLLLKLINDIEKEIAKGTKTVETKGEIRATLESINTGIEELVEVIQKTPKQERKGIMASMRNKLGLKKPLSELEQQKKTLED